MASGKQQETDLDCQDAAAKNVNETSMVHVQGQNWPLAVDIGPPISANSSLTQQLSSAGASSTGHPFLLVNQPDAFQGPLKWQRHPSLDGSQFTRDGRVDAGALKHIKECSTGLGVSGIAKQGIKIQPVLALDDSTHGEGAVNVGLTFGHQQHRGKDLEVNAGSGGAEVWDLERREPSIEPVASSENHQEDRFDLLGPSNDMGTGTGSSGLEQVSGTGTLVTSAGMGGSVGLGLSESLGQEGGKSGSGRSSGLSEVDGVASSFWWGRGGGLGGRGSHQGRGAGTSFSQGLGGGQVFNLWGSNPTGVPRAQAVAMAGAGTYAAAGRGNLAYALNLRKPAQGLLQGHGQPKDAWKEHDLQEGGGRDERPLEDLSAVHTHEHECEYSQVPIPIGTQRESSSNKTEQQVEPDREIDFDLQQEISAVVPPSSTILKLNEASQDMIANGNNSMVLDLRVSQDLQAGSGKDDFQCLTPRSPDLSQPLSVGPPATVSSPPVAMNSPYHSGPGSIPLEPQAPSCLDGPVTSGSLREGWNIPNLPKGKPTGTEAQTDQALVGDCSPLGKQDCLLKFNKVSNLGLVTVVGSDELDSKALEDARILSSIPGQLREPAHEHFGITSKQGDGMETSQGHVSGTLLTPHTDCVHTEDKCIAELSKPIVGRVEPQHVRQEFTVSRHMQESTDDRRKPDHAEVKYREMVAREGGVEREQEKERVLIKVKRERDNNREGDTTETLDKKQKFTNFTDNVCQITGRIADTEKVGFVPRSLGAGSFLPWAVGIGKGRTGNVLRNISISPHVPEYVTPKKDASPWPVASTSKVTKFVEDFPIKEGLENMQPEIKKGEPLLQEVQDLSGFEADRVIKEDPRVKIREKKDEDLQASATQKSPDLDDSSPTDYAISALRHFKFGSFLQNSNKASVPEISVNLQSRIETGKRKVDDSPSPGPLWTARHKEERKLLSMSAAANPLISTPDCLGQLQPQHADISNAEPSLPAEVPAKFTGTDSLAGAQHSPKCGSKQVQDSVSARVTSYCSSKSARDMWIHRFSTKAAVRPAVCEIPLHDTLGPSSSKQAVAPHHISQIHSKGHRFTEQGCSHIPKIDSHSDIKGKAPENIANSSSVLHVEGNFSAAGGLLLGTLDSNFCPGSIYKGDGSGDLPNEQSNMDYAASMNAVKAWRIQTSKYRESMTQNSSGNQVGLRRCWFCGLPGHCVVDCSETLDCELQKLGERAINSFDTWLRGEVLCLRCLGVGHWGAQCHLSVTEAASRAHDKAEFWRLNKRNNIESSREQGERQLELVTEGRGTCDYTNRDTAGVVCYNCNEMGHWARYCPRHRSSSAGGGQSSGSGKGHQSSTSSGSKLLASPNQGKWKAYAPIQSLEKSAQEETRARYVQQPETEGALPSKLEKYLTWESQSQPHHGQNMRPKADEANPEAKEHEGKSKRQGRNPQLVITEIMHLESERRPPLDGVACNKVEESRLCNQPPPVPYGMLGAIELIRLSRPDLQKWLDSPDLGTRVKGFFLRLRFGRWEAHLGGTGYRMVRITG
ncbi:hypothetical protein CY35_01G100300 [Sphagnum magellanicum]|nr:hypothetical protein CY35_01G100300 [Sphagnum magellanicum]KAH9575219.1 hypothetical protein CY35_01G100300 [Sphagnum magellanicum]